MSRRLLLAALLLASPAHADEGANALDARTQKMADSLKPDARTHFITGYQAFNDKDFKTASIEFEIAYKIDPEVPLLFTWAQSERLGGNCPHALELYQKYLYSDINRDQADYARHWIDACGGVVPTKIAPKSIVVDTGPPRYVWYKDKPADALVVGGAAVVAVGIVFFVKAGHSANAADAAMFLDDHARLRDDAIHQRDLGIGATIAGVVIAGAGVGLYLYDAHQHSAMISSDGKSVALAFQF
ncbi:MAG: hypothetical protein ABI591_22760 [Kofleriaceae bacterium]